MKVPSYLIIGCGHFGSRAAKKLLKKDPHSKIIAVDKNPRAIKMLSHLSIETVMDDGLSYLNRFLSEGRAVHYIIPSVPFHLAFEFILLRLKSFGARRTRVPSLSGLPNPVKGKTGDLYTSLADFLCPEDCPGPARYCTITRERRQNPLYKILRDLRGRFESKVIRSEQLGPGMGGFRPRVLLDLIQDIQKHKGKSHLVLISTASHCHGVTSALSFI
jgi:hypothetical protein